MGKGPDKKHPGVERLSDAFLKAKKAVIFHVVLRYHAGGVRGKAQGADCGDEEGGCGNQGKRKKQGLTHFGIAEICGQPLKNAVQ